MGNFMGMPTSTQVAFPPPPFPMPVSRPPIVPPMRQLDIGLGPPSPFEPGRTPLPLALPSLATRPPLLQQDANIQATNYFTPGGLPGQVPVDKIITANEINKQIPTQQQLNTQQNAIIAQQNNLNQQLPQMDSLNSNYVQSQQQVYQAAQSNFNPQQQFIYQNQNAPQAFAHSGLPGQQPIMQQQLLQQQLHQQHMQLQQQMQLQQFQQQQLQLQQQYPSQPPLQINQNFAEEMNQLRRSFVNELDPFSQGIVPINQTVFTPAIPQMTSTLSDQVPLVIQETVFPNQSIQVVSVRPQPILSYARPVDSVPIIPMRTLETVNQLKQSRQILEDTVPRGTQLSPYYIPEKQAYYEGQWINGLPGGYARIFYDSGAYFEGYFLNGEAFCKEGIWVYPDGSYYIGGIVHSAPNGLGQLTYRRSGMKYIGNWLNGKPHGQGRQQFKDGSFFQGTFINGVKQGIGKFIWANGSFYEGQFKNGFMEGHGVKQFSNGSRFVGEFRRNRLYGKGTYLFDRGQYKGQFVDNKRQGVGIFKYPDGRIYTGQFKQDRQQGRGRMFIPTGQVIDGEWQNGKNVVIHNISQSTEISDISLDDLTFTNPSNVQIPNVPITVSLEANPPQPSIPLNNSSNIQTNFYYSANYRPPQQNSSFHQ